MTSRWGEILAQKKRAEASVSIHHFVREQRDDGKDLEIIPFSLDEFKVFCNRLIADPDVDLTDDEMCTAGPVYISLPDRPNWPRCRERGAMTPRIVLFNPGPPIAGGGGSGNRRRMSSQRASSAILAAPTFFWAALAISRILLTDCAALISNSSSQPVEF
jgi:hypothetical protein